MNDNATQSFNPRIDNPNHFPGLKSICPQEFYKDKRFSIKELRTTSEMFRAGCMLPT